MTSYSDVCTRWVENVLGGHKKKALTTERVFPGTHGDERDRLYSYGRHFELARPLRNKRGEVTGFLLNGDTFSPSTSGHQREIRSAVQKTGITYVIIPHSVLGSAGITEDSIEIVDVLGDRTIERSKTYTEMQPRWQWRDVEEVEHREPDEAEKQRRIAADLARRTKVWEADQKWMWREIEQEGLFSVFVPLRTGPEVFPPRARGYEDLDWQYTQRVRHVTGVNRRLFASSSRRAEEIEVEYVGGEPISYTHTTRRHVLGEALIKAAIDYQVRLRCRECGGTGRRPHVGETWELSCQVCRRHRFSSSADLSVGSGGVWRARRRTALFLSGFDHNEPRLMYFFSELPTTKPRTVAEAYDSLMPDTVKIAAQMGREVHRQGDIFAVPVPTLTKRELTKLGARHERRGNLLNTNHEATDVAQLPDGRTFVRGTLTHAPMNRRPDHIRVTLPKGMWHLVLKNTVPISA